MSNEPETQDQGFFSDLPVEIVAACAADIVRYEYETRDFQAGAIDAAAYRSRRAVHGTYEQRQDGRFAVRGRVSAGVLPARQARSVAEAARVCGAEHIHLTTRQDVQLHGVPEEQVPLAMHRLLMAGLPSRGSGGNTPRNVIVCPLAGVCPREVFDVTPVARRFGLHLLATGAFGLPRKFKVALSGCACDCARAGATDLGFVAGAREGRPGFSVFAGGGLGQSCRRGDRVEEFLPVAETLGVAQAFLAVFDRLGDRQNRARARLRHVFDRLGPAAVLEEYRAARSAADAPVDVPVPPLAAAAAVGAMSGDARGGVPPWAGGLPVEGGCRFIPQRQEGLAAVPVHPPLGMLSDYELTMLAAAAERFGTRGMLRITPAQGLLILDVPRARLPELALVLERARPGLSRPAPLDSVAVCPGSSGCRLGLCDARAAAGRIAEAVSAAGIPGDVLAAADIRVNGCLNACALAPLGGIGLAGVVDRTEGGAARKAYRLTLATGPGEGPLRLGVWAGIIHEERIPSVVTGLLEDFRERRRDGELLGAYLEREGLERWRSQVVAAA